MKTLNLFRFTGTSAWADWDKEFILVMLTNRVYPNNGGKEILKFRTQASDLILDLLGYWLIINKKSK